MKKISKRCIVASPGEFKDIISLVFSRSVKEGGFINKFEEAFKEYLGAKEAILVSSGRFALCLILKMLGIRPEDKIILSAYNFPGVPALLLKEGYLPLFVDADKETYQIDTEKIEEKIDKSTKAIIVTHLFGQACDLNRILEIARKHNLFVIEDSAHSLGSYYRGKHTAAIADAGLFSLTGSKTINTSFGGMIVTNNLKLADKIREELLNYPFPAAELLIRERLLTYIYAVVTNRIFYSMIGWPMAALMSLFNLDFLEIYKSSKKSEITEQKMRCTNFQAALGLRQMALLERMVSGRKRAAGNLIRNLHPSVSLQKIPPGCEPNYFMFAICAKDKPKVFKKLLFKGIDSNLSYACDCSYLVTGALAPIARSLSNSILTIHLPFDLKEEEVLYIAESLNKIKGLLH